MNSLLFLIFILSTLSPQTVMCLKCYICEFNAAYCKGIECYNNPDICSTQEFSTALVPVGQCPHNCYTKAVSNAAGMVIKWSRMCAPVNDLTKGFKCRTDYQIGARIEQCTCDKDFCNNSNELQTNVLIIIFSIISSLIML